MKYNLNNPVDLSRYKKQSEKLVKKGAFVEQSEIKPPKSNQQMRYMRLLIKWFAIESANTIDYVYNVMFKGKVNKETYYRETVIKETGEVIIWVRSSANLDMGEMAHCITKFREYASMEASIYLPSPDEHEFLKHIEIEAERHKEFL